MKRKMRKFRLGGGTDDMGNKAGYEESPPDFEAPKEKSFKEAFAEARAKKQATFTFKNPKTGKMESFHTRTKDEESKPAAAPKVETPKVETSESPRSRSGGRGSKPASAKVGTGRYDDPTSSYMDRVLSPFKRLAGGNLFGQREVERVSRGAGISTEEARRRLREAGMNRGGAVKKMAGGGTAYSSASKRADGCAVKGKTRGRII